MQILQVILTFSKYNYIKDLKRLHTYNFTLNSISVCAAYISNSAVRLPDIRLKFTNIATLTVVTEPFYKIMYVGRSPEYVGNPFSSVTQTGLGL